jgi:hypothetical protein
MLLVFFFRCFLDSFVCCSMRHLSFFFTSCTCNYINSFKFTTSIFYLRFHTSFDFFSSSTTMQIQFFKIIILREGRPPYYFTWLTAQKISGPAKREAHGEGCKISILFPKLYKGDFFTYTRSSRETISTCVIPNGVILCPFIGTDSHSYKVGPSSCHIYFPYA